ncbi:MAG: MerR family transcriptional regulator [Acidobacteriaceae bacterium]
MRRTSHDRRTPATPQIPDKLYFRIGEVARLCAVPAYVLRFWESEFPQLKPGKSGTGQRLYRRHEVEAALRIKALLYSEGYTIPGARQALQQESHARKAEVREELPLARAGLEAPERKPRLSRLRSELREILGLLSGAPAAGTPGNQNEKLEQGQAEERPRPSLFEGHER